MQKPHERSWRRLVGAEKDEGMDVKRHGVDMIDGNKPNRWEIAEIAKNAYGGGRSHVTRSKAGSARWIQA